MLLCHIEGVSVDNARTAKQWVHYQHFRVQSDTKACNILFIARLTYDVDIQFQLFTVYWSITCISHSIMLIVCLYSLWRHSCAISLQYEIYCTANNWYWICTLHVGHAIKQLNDQSFLIYFTFVQSKQSSYFLFVSDN